MADDGIGSVRPPPGGLQGQTVAGKYELVRLLGEGGMGAVYEARNTATLKRVAVKLLLSPELAHHPGIVKRFFREARASSVIESDHVVEVFDSGTDPVTGFPYMVMEYLDGEDLSHAVDRLGPLDPRLAAKVGLQAAMGLAKAHEQGTVHRDIKPANLYISRRDTGDLVVKVLDFGIAKVKMESFAETSAGLTRTGSMLGTPIYMSPEQARGASKLDATADVWSLGVCLYEFLSGAVPFEGASSLGDLMVSIITHDIPLLQDKAPWVPPELAEITHRAMSRDITKRFQNAGELRDALAAIIPDGPTITPDLLAGVPAAQRAFVAPRLTVTDDGMLRATTRTGFTTTSAGATSAPQTSRSAVAAATIGGIVLLLGGGSAAGLMLRNSDAPATPATVVVSAEPTVIERNVVEKRTFDLTFDPPGATVMVDGTAVELTAGKLTIQGEVGSARKVKATFEGREIEKEVMISRERIIPDRIEIPAAAKPVAHVAAPLPGKPAAPKPVEPAAPKPVAKPVIDTEFR